MNQQIDFRILIIDDNPAIHQDFQKILKTEHSNAHLNKLNQLIFGEEIAPESDLSSNSLPNFQIDCASQGSEGIQCIQQALNEGEPYALAFVDIRMPPGLDGVQTITKIWALDPEIQIVICTAYSDYSWEDTVNALGLRDNLLILKKPFDSVAVRQLACSLTKKWRLMQESKNRQELLEQTVKDRTDSLQQTLSMLEHQATHDSLTNLPNRVLLVERVEQEIVRAQENNSSFIMVFIDLDRFKLINDSFNHETGDTLLKIVAERLSSITRREDMIARLSGDEFIFIAVPSETAHMENGAYVAERILATLNKTLKIGQRELMISASLGISVYPQDGTTVEELLRHADLAMYRAKALGGNQFQLYDSELQEKCVARLEKETDLRQALIENEFFIEYQPQYDTKHQMLIGIEALIRWNHPEHGIRLPMDFIPLAEDTGLIVPIGEWLIRTACKQNKAWQDKGLTPLPIAVNIATKQFMQPNFIAMIKTILTETRLEAKYLEVEITENVLINSNSVIHAIRQLKQMGVNIVLDDFGTGNSGFNHLHHLPIDQLKIDQSFVQNINNSRSDEIIIQAIINMANSLKLDVVAEGIETLGQLKFLESHSCYKVQGFYFNQPMSANQLEQLILSFPDNIPSM
ncbi:EAL domain-containing protein [Legionella lytica]|uniref:EAL domain-containing protein n=1 Tax=Legionella lytica TaxID=96232 RepID=A0ABW8D742_9GAMM